MFMVATGITVLGAETMLVLVAAAAPTTGPQGGAPTFERVLELRATGDPATPSVSGNSLLDHGLSVPVGSTSLRPITTGPADRTTVLCAEFTDPISYRSDRFGFNNPDEVWDRDTIDVILLGDSYTHGVCVEPEHQIASYLRETMGAVNLGIRGVGPFHELAILREYGGLRPTRHVVWVFYEGNDLWDLHGTEAGQPWLHEYLDGTHTQRLADHQLEIDRAYDAWLDSLVSLSPEQIGERLEGFRPGILESLKSVPRLEALQRLVGFGVLAPSRKSALGQLPEILAQARAEVAGAGGEFLVVYLPAFNRFTTHFGEGTPGRTEFVRLMSEIDMPFLDLVPVFEETGHPRELWTNPRGHLSPEGYRVVADAITQVISPPA